MKSILISGYYGFGNTGDEAILSGIIQQIREKIPDCSFVVVSGNPDETTRLHGVKTIDRLKFSEISQEIEKSDLVILGGGGLFQDHHQIEIASIFTQPGLGIASYAIVPLIASMHLKPVMFYAQGFGPLYSKESKTFVSFICSLADIITVRDSYSKNLLEELSVESEKIIVTADPAFELIPSSKEIVTEIFEVENFELGDEKFICVSVRRWIDKSLEEKYIDHLAQSLNNFIDNHDLHIIFLPFQNYDQYNSDIEVANEIIKKISKKNRCHAISKVYNPQEIAGIIARADLLIGMRYHSVIFAAISHIPVVALSYDLKVANLMNDLQLGDFSFDMFNSDAKLLNEIINNAWNSRDDIKKILQNSLDSIRANNYSPAIVHSFISGLNDEGIGKYRPTYFHNHTFNKIDSLKSIETIHSQSRLLLSLQIEHQNQMNLLRNDSDVLRSQNTELISLSNSLQSQNEELKIKNLISESELQMIYSSITWKIVSFIGRNLIITKRKIFSLGGRILPEVIKKPLCNILFRSSIIEPEQALPDDIIQFIKDASNRTGSNLMIMFSGTRFVENEGQRPMRLAKELAKHGYYLLFAYWRWTPQECSDYGIINDNIFVLPIDKLLNYKKQIIEFEYPDDMTKVLMMEFPHPSLFELISLSNCFGWTTAYDVLDDWEEFSQVGQADWYDKDLEKYVILNSDLVSSVSPALCDKLENLGAINVKLIPNAADYDVLSDKPARVLKEGKITIGYFGHLTSSWFDWDLIIELAEKHMDWIFHLIGHGGPDLNLPLNIILHGKVEPQDLSSYAKNWDVAIIPFKTTKLTKSVDPIKIYEYLYFGLPVVVQGIPHLDRYPHVFVANTFDEFEACIEKAHNDDVGNITVFLQNNTWEKRVVDLIEEIQRTQNEKSPKNYIRS